MRVDRSARPLCPCPFPQAPGDRFGTRDLVARRLADLGGELGEEAPPCPCCSWATMVAVENLRELLADTAAAAADFLDGLDERPVGAVATLEELRVSRS